MTAIRNLKPDEAYAALQANAAAILLDVRDPLEFSFIGHPLGAISLPWKLAPDWRPNPEFLARARQLVPNPETPVYLRCRSGQRSLDAAKALEAAGYRQLVNIEEGFEGPLDAQRHRGTVGGWRCHGLPWEQS